MGQCLPLHHGFWLTKFKSRFNPRPMSPSSPSTSASFASSQRSPSRRLSGGTSGASGLSPAPPLEVTLPQYTHRRLYADTTRAYPKLPTRMLLASKAIAWLRQRRRGRGRRRSEGGSGFVGGSGDDDDDDNDDGTADDDDGDDALHTDARVFVCAEAAISVGVGVGAAGAAADTSTVAAAAAAVGAAWGEEWAKDAELRSRACRPDVAERLWALPDESRLVAVRRSSGGGASAAELLQAVMERKPPPGPGDLLRRAYLDLDFNPNNNGGGCGGGGEDVTTSSASASSSRDDVPLHFVPATVGDLLSVALGAGLVGGAVAAELRRIHGGTCHRARISSDRSERGCDSETEPRLT